VKKGSKSETITADFWHINNIFSYYAANMDITKKAGLSSILHDRSRIKSFIRNQEFAFIGPKANVSASFISDNCKIHGTVTNSIIFPGADIGENTIVKNSIVLPFVKIGKGAKIINTIIDERTDLSPENNYLNIGNRCKVGSEYEGIENKEFPRLLNNSITLIGKNSRIPDEAGIGGACYVASGKGAQYFLKNKFLYNGESLK
jgi:glucose-1-phosphate adenylyltransferase